MSKFCPNCGHENRDVAEFCGNCGNKLTAPNFARNFRDTGSSTNVSGTSTTPNAASGSGGEGSLCCGVLLILFIIILIMSMG